MITADPHTVPAVPRLLFIDFRVAKAAQQRSVLIEIKGFERESQVDAFMEALGKYDYYLAALALIKFPDPLYLAVPREAYYGIISEPVGAYIRASREIRLLVYNTALEEIEQWLPHP